MESAASFNIVEHVLLVVGVILAAGALSSFLAQKIRVPDIVLFILAGIILGPELSNIINVSAGSALNQLILNFGASYILFDGGATLKFRVLKSVWITLVLIATVGVLITAFVTGFAAHWLLGMPVLAALLLGATIAATDPATLIPVFRQVHIREHVAQTVMSESAFNDAMGAIVTFTFLDLVTQAHAHFSLSSSLMDLAQQAGFGILAGAIMGYLAVVFIAHERLGFLREHLPLVTLLVVVGAYLGATDFNASGFMAVFVAGVFLGNRESFGFQLHPGGKERLEDFVDTTGMIMRMFIFILLGTQVDFAVVKEYFWMAMAVVLIFMFIARPLTVFICAGVDRRAKWTFKELLFMCWTRETGVIPGALVGIMMGIPALKQWAPIIASVTFIAILTTILLQATTTSWVAGKLGLLESR